MVMQSMRKGKGAGIIKFFFMSLLVLATGGLVLTDVGGFFRGGVGGNDVAKVGAQNIPLVAFDQKMRRTIARLGMTPEQAYQFGYMKQFLGSEVRSLLIQQEAREKGIRISRDVIAKQVQTLVEPMIQDGQTHQEVLDQILLSQGLTEAELVRQMGAEAAGKILMGALATDLLGSSDALGKTMYSYQNEKRDIALISFANADFTLDHEASEEELKTFYDKSKRNYVIPESRNIDLAIILHNDIEQSIEVSDAELQEIYDSELELFTEPEKRLVEQAILQKESDAMKVAKLTEEGTPLKDAVQAVTGNETGYIAAQEFAEDDLMENIAAPVFDAKDKGSVIGPVKTSLGHYVVVMNDIIAENETGFADVKEELKKEIIAQRMDDEKFDRLNLVEDLVAGGASLQEVAQQVPLEIKTIEKVTAFAGANILKEYGPDADAILQASFEYDEGEISPVAELSENGQQYVVAVKTVTAENYKPFEEVKQDVLKKWTTLQKRSGNKAQVDNLYKKLTSGEFDGLNAIAKDQGTTMQTLKEVKRGAEVPEPLSQNSIAMIFALNEGDYAVVNTTDGFGIAKVTKITLPATDDLSEEDMQEVLEGLARDSVNELNALYIETLQNKHGVSVNDGLLERIYGSPETPSF